MVMKEKNVKKNLWNTEYSTPLPLNYYIEMTKIYSNSTSRQPLQHTKTTIAHGDTREEG